MKPKFKVEHFTEEEVVKAMNEKDFYKGMRGLGIMPNYRFPFRYLNYRIVGKRYLALLSYFKLYKRL